MSQQKEYISLHALQKLVHQHLAGAFPFPLWITAEIAELKVNHSGHCYMELVDKPPGDERAIPRAKASAVIWRSRYPSLAASFAAATGGALAAGLKVLVLVTVNFHELYGYSLVITDIEPSYTLGDMERRRRETVDRLRADGLFDMNRSLPMPLLLQRVAVVSSSNAAGYRDFMKEIARSGYDIRTELFDSLMQGDGAEESIIRSLGEINDRAAEFDAVAVIRGGGSRSDLSCFDSYLLCSYLAQLPLPLLTGIGHDKDISVADMVAAEMLKTPTAVAGRITESFAAFEALLDRHARSLAQLASDMLAEQRTRTEFAARRLAAHATAMTRRMELRLERLGSELAPHAEALLRLREHRLQRLGERLDAAVRNILHRTSARLDAAEKIVAARDPRRILALGFGLLRSSDGRTLRSVEQLAPGASVTAELADGTASLRVEKTRKNR